MKTRYDKLVVVRSAESRIAAAAFATASADVGAQHALANRLRSALNGLALTSGPTSAAEMGARMELASRMAMAQGVARIRIEAAVVTQFDAGTARKSARRALDAVRDVQRDAVNNVIRRHEIKNVPLLPTVSFK